MRVLILDDDDTRHKRFGQVFGGFDVKHVHTVDETTSALINGDVYDLVHLDHDLNDHGYVSKFAGAYGSQELNGYDVARFIARDLDPQKRPKRVVVHSWNPPGARMMVDILREAGIPTTYEPFQGAHNDYIGDMVAWFEKERPCVDGVPVHAAPPFPPPDNNEQGG